MVTSPSVAVGDVAHEDDDRGQRAVRLRAHHLALPIRRLLPAERLVRLHVPRHACLQHLAEPGLGASDGVGVEHLAEGAPDHGVHRRRALVRFVRERVAQLRPFEHRDARVDIAQGRAEELARRTVRL
jgi:hypothetical protein